MADRREHYHHTSLGPSGPVSWLKDGSHFHPTAVGMSSSQADDGDEHTHSVELPSHLAWFEVGKVVYYDEK